MFPFKGILCQKGGYKQQSFSFFGTNQSHYIYHYMIFFLNRHSDLKQAPNCNCIESADHLGREVGKHVFTNFNSCKKNQIQILGIIFIIRSAPWGKHIMYMYVGLAYYPTFPSRSFADTDTPLSILQKASPPLDLPIV